MSRVTDALQVLVDMLSSGEDRDRVAAADKLLRSEHPDKDYFDRAIETLEEVMNDPLAKPNDRVNAADKLKTYTSKTRTGQSMEYRLAAMTNEELRAIVLSAELPRLSPAQDPLLD